MARMTARVQQGLLNTHDDTQAISVDSPDWFVWLKEHRVFRFTSPNGNFTARKEQRAVGWYWYAYRRQHGSLRNAYLGKSEELTLSRLMEIANTLNTVPTFSRQNASSLAQQMLLTTKITPPALSPTIIARPRLTALLHEYASCKLLLVTGPAGSGKTTLLSSWLYESSLPVAWVSLDESDNDPGRFWGYLLTALQKHFPGFANHLLTLLPTLQTDTLEPFLVLLINALATLPNEIVLVLDDYHLLTSQPIHESVAFLLEHMPEQLRMVVASRFLPPLPVARLRARGMLAEFDFADLRFTPQETRELLEALIDDFLPDENFSRLLERMEGWATGLTLAAQALRAGHRRTYAQASPQRDSQAIFEYLASEVLSHQSAQMCDFLLHTSILERFHGELCDAVTLQKQSQDLLRQLEHDNLFLSPLDKHHLWYRYHQLFTDFLRNRLEQTYSAQIPMLYGRAAHWHAQNDMLAEAITYALQGQDFALAAQLIEKQGQDVLLRHEVIMLGTWLRALPEEVICDRPHLCVFAAWTILHTSHTGSIERYLHAAEHGPGNTCLEEDERRLLRGEIAAIRARVAIYQNRIEDGVTLARQALGWLSKDDHSARGEAVLSLGTASEVLGETQVAENAYREAIEHSKQCGNLRATMLAFRSLAMLYRDQGRLHLARKLYEDGLEYALQTRQEHLPPVGFLYVGLGELFYEWNDLEAAEHYLRKGITLGQRGGDVKIWLLGYVGLIYTTLACGKHEQVWSLFVEAERLARQTNFTRGIAWLKLIRPRLSYLQGDTVPLLDWAQECELDLDSELDGFYEYDYHQLAQAFIELHKPDLALHLLHRLQARSEQTRRPGLKLSHLLSMARAYDQQERLDRALASLEEALSLAKPQRYMRTFIDEGPQIASLLKRLRQSYQQSTSAAQSCSLGYLNRLLSAFHGTHAPQPVQANAIFLTEQLSQREQEVLHLLASGHSNAEIAETLIIGLNTVKTHLKNIYGKLGTHNRTQAIAQARTLHLL